MLTCLIIAIIALETLEKETKMITKVQPSTYEKKLKDKLRDSRFYLFFAALIISYMSLANITLEGEYRKVLIAKAETHQMYLKELHKNECSTSE